MCNTKFNLRYEGSIYIIKMNSAKDKLNKTRYVSFYVFSSNYLINYLGLLIY